MKLSCASLRLEAGDRVTVRYRPASSMPLNNGEPLEVPDGPLQRLVVRHEEANHGWMGGEPRAYPVALCQPITLRARRPACGPVRASRSSPGHHSSSGAADAVALPSSRTSTTSSLPE